MPVQALGRGLARVLPLFIRALLFQPLLKRLSLDVEFVQLLVEVFAHGLARGLPLLDLHAGLVEGELHLVELLSQFLGAAHAHLLGLPLPP